MYSESQTKILYMLIITCVALIAIAVLAIILYTKTKNDNKKLEKADAENTLSLF